MASDMIQTIDLTSIVVTFITVLPATIAAIVTLIIALKNHRDVQRLKESQDAASVKIEEVHKATNSMKDALVAATAKEFHAAGIAEEKVRKEAEEGMIAKAVKESKADSTASTTGAIKEVELDEPVKITDKSR